MRLRDSETLELLVVVLGVFAYGLIGSLLGMVGVWLIAPWVMLPWIPVYVFVTAWIANRRGWLP